jgi:serine/threonine protein kinase
VIKTYKRREASEYFWNETEAFIHLSDGPPPHRDIVGYYGSFVVKDSFNLILEYADKGDLESYFRKNKQPKTPQDIFRFWKGFFRLIYGLLKIHNAGDRESGHPHNLLG